MFRTGGSSNEGITSGLRSGYKRGRVVEPGGYKGDIAFDWKKAIDESPEAYKSYQKFLGDYPKSQARSDFLINFGLDLASRSPSGNIISTAAESAKEPFKIMQQQTAYDKAGERQEKKDFMDAYMEGQAKIWAGDSAGQVYKNEKDAMRAREAYTSQVAHNAKWKPEWENMSKEELQDNQEYIDWENERRLIDSDISIFEEETGISMETMLGGADKIKEMQDAWATNLKQSEEMMTHPETGEEIEVGEFYSDSTNRGYLFQKVYQMMLDFVAQEKRKRRKWKGIYKTYESGGRAGYQAGNLVEQMDVDVMTPKGDMAMQETVEEGAMPDQLSYEELRSRLPVEITDDIVRLLVSSGSALGDFAQIQTQQDVDNFNAKYGVNLVLPSEA